MSQGEIRKNRQHSLGCPLVEMKLLPVFAAVVFLFLAPFAGANSIVRVIPCAPVLICEWVQVAQ